MVAEGRGEFSATRQAEFYLWYNKHAITSQETPLSNGLKRNSVDMTTPVTPLLNSMIGKTRLRISFCSEEVARLQQWFEFDPHPSRHTMTKYMLELNDLPARIAGLKPLDLTNIMYWFKNARAAARRNGRSITSEDLSDEEGQCEREIFSASPPSLPNNNAAYSIRDPNPAEDVAMKCNDDQPQSAADDLADDSDMDEELSVTDDESESNDREAYQSEEKPILGASKSDDGECVKPDDHIDLSTSCSSSKANVNFMNSVASSRLPGYPFPYGTFPMAYLQSQINPFYKDWTEKVQSAVAQATAANTAQHNMALLKPESIKSDCELSKAERQKRHRAFIDPVSEIPKLEQWFTKDTHPSHFVIEQICDDLNRGEFRSRYPKLSPKNIQLWFKNHRAKVKRMRVGGGGLTFGGIDASQLKSSPNPHGNLPLSMLEGV